MKMFEIVNLFKKIRSDIAKPGPGEVVEGDLNTAAALLTILVVEKADDVKDQ